MLAAKPLEGQKPLWLDIWTMDRDLSDEDSVADLSFEAESPLVPPVELLERLPSYDCLFQGGGQQVFFPPLEAPRRPREQTCWSSFLEHSRVPVVTEEVAREALLSFVSSKCCYGRSAASDLVIQQMKQQMLCRVRCPSCSGAKRRAKQPGRCQLCSGSGRHRCSTCSGRGNKTCATCKGEKKLLHFVQLVIVWCSTCSGRGNKTCATCKGEKKLLHFVQLVIVWKNSLFEFVSEHRLNCPGQLLAKAKGENLFKDENTTVYPLADFPLREISLASQRGIAQHSAATLASRARVLQQRQTIELVPLTEVHYWYQGKNNVYYIYGTDHRVYVADYPERYCCSCTII
ncbi:hypothetical protein D623_10011820 [Myotis brandtii]|uniref:Uncharacterized protein n=1 Tax=Myotis brandtii TaxID=109478 RepID=S7N658_MYOBR|nr:hypothetical protein D623_10011820 [Myotis brandtii]